jgi:hypothetical protein
VDALTDRCPWCQTLIPRTKFLEIQEKIRAQERQRLAEAEATARKQLDEKYRQDLETAKRAIESRATAEATKQLTVLSAERDRALEKLKQVEAREAEIRKQMEERAAREAQRLLGEAAARHRKEITQQRESLEKHRDQAILKARTDFHRDLDRYQKRVQDLERQLQRRTTHEVGDGAELDLLDALREAFPGDRITRVHKGQPGADIFHEVLYKGEACGRTVIDSKNRQVWHNTYVTKLREDQVAAKADHAILATTVFPSGKKELTVEEGVIVVSPARVVQIAGLLRTAMVRMHVLGLSIHERTGKMTRLYKFITSESYVQRFGEADRLASQLLDLDVEEQHEHQKVWKKRGAAETRLKHVLREIDIEITAILDGSDDGVKTSA